MDYPQQNYATQQDYGAVEERVSVVEELDREVEQLAKLVEYAATRLAKVLAPEYDTPENAGNHPAPIVSPIRGTQLALSLHISRMRVLLDRVEV